MIAHYGGDLQVANQRHDLFRIGSVADIVPQADNGVCALSFDIGQHLRECFQVPVYVRYYSDLHMRVSCRYRVERLKNLWRFDFSSTEQ